MSMRRQDHFKEAVVGFFMVAVVALLAYFTIVISGVDMLAGRSRLVATVAFQEVGGLKDRDSVMYRGTKVGAVEHVEVTATNLLVHFYVDRNVVLRDGYSITVCNLSMLGGNYMLLDEGAGRTIDLETTLLHGTPPTDWMRDLSEVARNFREITRMSAIKSIITNIDVVSTKAVTFATTANKVAERAMGMAERADGIIQRVERGEGTVGKLLSRDETIYDDIKKTVANATEITDRLKRGEGLAGRLLAKDDPIYDHLDASLAAFKKSCESLDMGNVRTDVQAVLADAKTLLTDLTEVSGKLKRGESSVGKMMSSSEMYDQVNGLIRDVRQIIDNYRDSTPITTFSSLAAGAL